MNVDRSPQLWESGCTQDPVRNTFVIPCLVSAIERYEPSSIIDIGCGTGYISREVERRLNRPHISWHLLDRAPEMLAFARDKVRGGTNVQYHRRDLCTDVAKGELACDMGFAAYTFLDFALTALASENVSDLIRPGGQLMIFMPDVLEDVIEAGRLRRELLDQYRSGHCTIEKLDKFTRSNVLFEANRVEHVIELFTRKGLVLAEFLKHEFDAKRSHYCLILWKVTRSSTGPAYG
jgi:trans-aconitate methyltransferase